MQQFDIPVVLIIFKRKDTTLRILQRVSQVKPRKLYLMGDEGRNDEERGLVAQCRKAVEESINWDCEIVKNYAVENRGVYANIGLGAKWVFEREPRAIFLEDDNLPEVTFFRYCEELLEKYNEDSRVLWICGTNYLGKYKNETCDSYMFTKHLLPCGWASWAHKFIKYYDGELLLAEDQKLIGRLKYEYENRALYAQQMRSVKWELENKHSGNRFLSWDHQMAFSIRVNNLYGISPRNNQIMNIGVDSFSEHGGNSFNRVMTQRFCGMKSYPLEFPLAHPKTLLCDRDYEYKIGRIIERPFSTKAFVSTCIRKILNIPERSSIKDYLIKGWLKK